jgi:hypothetical protein
MSWEARWPGECSACGGKFNAGTQIRMTGPGQFAHVTCPEMADIPLTVVDLRPGETICGRCHLVHRGECF